MKTFILNANRMNATANSGSRVFRSVVSILLFVVVCVGLYYLYNFLYGLPTSETNPNLKLFKAISSKISSGNIFVFFAGNLQHMFWLDIERHLKCL